MIVIHDRHNTKTDYLVCYMLLSNLPARYDEYSLRKMFFQKNFETDYEQGLSEIKDHFETNSSKKSQVFEIEKVLQIIISELINASDFEFSAVRTVKNVEKIVRYVREKKQCIDVMLHIFLLLCYCQRRDIPLLLYRSICRKLYYFIVAEETVGFELIWQRLLQRKLKYYDYHDLSLNSQSVEKLNTHKQELIAHIPVAQLAVCGSFAIGQGTNYSDLDILIIVPEKTDKDSERMVAYDYWADKIPIPFDINVLKESELNDLPIVIQRTIRLV